MIQIGCALLFFCFFWWALLRAVARIGHPKKAAMPDQAEVRFQRSRSYSGEAVSPILLLLTAVLSAFLFSPQDKGGLVASSVSLGILVLLVLGFMFTFSRLGEK